MPSSYDPIHYEINVIARTPSENNGPTLELVDRINVHERIYWADELAGPGAATVSTDVSRISENIGERFADLAKTPCELWIYREGQIVHAGPIIGLQTQGNTLTVISQGVLYYLRYMYIASTYPLAQGARYNPFKIVKDLIDNWQNEPYGNFGIKTSHIGKPANTPANQGGSQLTTIGDGSTTYDGIPLMTDEKGRPIKRTVSYLGDELREVYVEIEALATSFDAFDYWIDNSTYVSEYGLQQFGPESRRNLILKGGRRYVEGTSGPTREVNRGEDKSDYVALEGRNLQDVRLWGSVAAGDIASWNKAVVTSSAENLSRSTQVNEELLATYGRVGSVRNIDGVQGASTAAAYAKKMEEQLKEYHLEIGGEREYATAISVVGADPMDFGPGDTIRFLWDTGYTTLDTKRDVFKKHVTVDNAGNENITVEFP